MATSLGSSRGRFRSVRLRNLSLPTVLAPTTRRLRNDRGQAIVELALALPVLMLVLFGAIELVRGVSYWLDANHIANEGARWAAVNRLPAYGSVGATTTPSGANIQAYLASQLNQTNFPSAQRCISVIPDNGSSSQVGDPVTVRVTLSWPLPLISGLAHVFGVSMAQTSIPIHGDAKMRLEQVPTDPTGTAACP